VQVLGRHDVYEDAAEMKSARLKGPLTLSCTVRSAVLPKAPFRHVQQVPRGEEDVVAAVAQSIVRGIPARRPRNSFRGRSHLHKDPSQPSLPWKWTGLQAIYDAARQGVH